MCVVALLEHGADPNHSDACGRNALRVAAKSGHRGVVRLLEEYNARSHKINLSTAHTSSSANSIASSKPNTFSVEKNFNIIVSGQLRQQKRNRLLLSCIRWAVVTGPISNEDRWCRWAITVRIQNPVRT